MHRLRDEGRLITDNLVYYNEQWIKAGLISELGFNSAPIIESNYIARPAYGQTIDCQKPKKKHGCLIPVFIFFGLFLVSATLIFFLVINPRINSKNMNLGRAEKIAKETVSQSGGTVIVDEPDSILDGMSIEVPDDAYDDDTKFTVTTKEIKSHEFGENINPITPIFHVKNGGEYSVDGTVARKSLELIRGIYHSSKRQSIVNFPFQE
jgi:hypothetical protein